MPENVPTLCRKNERMLNKENNSSYFLEHFIMTNYDSQCSREFTYDSEGKTRTMQISYRSHLHDPEREKFIRHFLTTNVATATSDIAITLLHEQHILLSAGLSHACNFHKIHIDNKQDFIMRQMLFSVMAFAAIAPLVSADLVLISDEDIYDAADRHYTIAPDCRPERDEESCNAIAGCDWVVGQCFHKVIEGCGFVYNNPDACKKIKGCIWMSDERDFNVGKCADKDELSKEGICSIDGLKIASKASCNSLKGCSWRKDEEDEYFCAEARAQLECDIFLTEATCQRAGCVSRTKKGVHRCAGRWENKFLRSLKRMDGEEAKKAIEEEYGKGTYRVVIVGSANGARRRLPRIRNRRRIRLYTNKKGKVKRIPKFG